MKHFSIYSASVAMLAAVALTPALAATKCDNPKGAIELRACAKAVEGADALRRFVTRTASIYALYYFEYARSDDSPTPPVATVGL